MTSRCLELGAYKMAREQARSKVYTPPELRRIEKKVFSKTSDPVYHCIDGKLTERKSETSSTKVTVRKRSR